MTSKATNFSKDRKQSQYSSFEAYASSQTSTCIPIADINSKNSQIPILKQKNVNPSHDPSVNPSHDPSASHVVKATIPPVITTRYKANLNFNSHVDHIFSVKSSNHLPAYFDWRDRGIDSRVVDQKTCGSCWLISSYTAIEDHCKIRNAHIVFDMDTITSTLKSKCKMNEVCEGGNPAQLLKSCQLSEKAFVKNVKMYSDIGTIKHELMEKGPLIAGMLIYDNFLHGKFGSHGIYLDTVKEYDTNGNPVFAPLEHLMGAHSVCIVGWGVEHNVQTRANHYETVHYWICRNSWGSQWGNGGYFKIATHKVNKQVQLEQLYQFQQQEWGGVLSFDVEIVNRHTFSDLFITPIPFVALSFLLICIAIAVKKYYYAS